MVLRAVSRWRDVAYRVDRPLKGGPLFGSQRIMKWRAASRRATIKGGSLDGTADGVVRFECIWGH